MRFRHFEFFQNSKSVVQDYVNEEEESILFSVQDKVLLKLFLKELENNADSADLKLPDASAVDSKIIKKYLCCNTSLKLITQLPSESVISILGKGLDFVKG